MGHKVEFSPKALAELLDLDDYIATGDGTERAIGYLDRIEDVFRFPSAAIEKPY